MVELASMSWTPFDWHRIIASATWAPGERVKADTLRCGACRKDFFPPSEGAVTFTDEHNSVRLTVCAKCEHLLVKRN